jgi:hypothetical protein
MTIKEKLIQMGMEHGLFENSAKTIMDSVIQEDINGQNLMYVRWDDDYACYPEMLINTLWITFKRHALKWLNENQPRHWAKPVFEEQMKTAVSDLQMIQKSLSSKISISLAHLTAIAGGSMKMESPGDLGMFEARAILIEHQTR